MPCCKAWARPPCCPPFVLQRPAQEEPTISFSKQSRTARRLLSLHDTAGAYSVTMSPPYCCSLAEAAVNAHKLHHSVSKAGVVCFFPTMDPVLVLHRFPAPSPGRTTAVRQNVAAEFVLSNGSSGLAYLPPLPSSITPHSSYLCYKDRGGRQLTVVQRCESKSSEWAAPTRRGRAHCSGRSAMFIGICCKRFNRNLLAGSHQFPSGLAIASMPALAAPEAATPIKYYGVTRMSDGRWRSTITNKEDRTCIVGYFDTAEDAALAHDRAILAILGPAAYSMVFNFRAGFSNTELRFLKGRNLHPITIIRMIKTGTYDAEFARFAEYAYDAYLDPELALDIMTFRLAYHDVLNQRKATATNPVAARDIEREIFLEAARNKAADQAWVRSFHHRRLHVGMTIDDDNRWPPMVPDVDVDVGDDFVGNELIYPPNGSSYVDEMKMF